MAPPPPLLPIPAAPAPTGAASDLPRASTPCGRPPPRARRPRPPAARAASSCKRRPDPLTDLLRHIGRHTAGLITRPPPKPLRRPLVPTTPLPPPHAIDLGRVPRSLRSPPLCWPRCAARQRQHRAPSAAVRCPTALRCPLCCPAAKPCPTTRCTCCSLCLLDSHRRAPTPRSSSPLAAQLSSQPTPCYACGAPLPGRAACGAGSKHGSAPGPT